MSLLKRFVSYGDASTPLVQGADANVANAIPIRDADGGFAMGPLVAESADIAALYMGPSASKTTSFTVDDTAILWRVDCTAGAVTAILPVAASSEGMTVILKKTDASTYALIVDGNGAETIDGATTVTVTIQYGSVMLTCDATGWHVVGRYHETETIINAGTVNATTSLKFPAPNRPCTLVGWSLYVDTTVTANDTDYWTASAVNKTTGAGSTALLAASDPNTTKSTGGTGLTNYVARELTLSATPANLAFAAKECAVLTLTKAASAPNLVGLVAVARWL